jgi:GNAT superfamily N-acetyltransferase
MRSARSRLFADYAPEARGAALPAGLELREATSPDAPEIVAAMIERHGKEPHDFAAQLRQQIAASDALVLVATVDDRFAGFGRAAFFEPTHDAPSNSAPSGWYLFGVLVTTPHRRCGIARELTRRRLEWISARADEAFYFANALNRASLDLHRELGFSELTRDFSFPGATFTGGVGVLCRAQLRSDR